MTIGVLALQGDFSAHRGILERCGVAVRAVRQPEDLDGCSGLVIPGGESTVLSLLCERYGLLTPLRERLLQGWPALGTCAGMIFLARGLQGASPNIQQQSLGVLDVEVARNAYGTQVDSFEAEIEVPAVDGPPLHGVFIRAPRVTACGPGVEVLARHQNEPVLVRQGAILGATFHPEIAGDIRIHQLWLQLIPHAS